MSVDWGETKAILLEVESLFNRDDDIRDVQDIKKMAHEIEVHCANNLKDAKEIIKQMTNAVSTKEAEIMAPTETTHAVHLEKFIRDKENVSAQLEATRSALDAKREAIAKLAKTALQLRDKASELEATGALGDSRTAYALSLYAKISNVTWDYSAPSGKLAGCVGNDRTRELHSFSIDTRSKTSFEVANTLWDRIADGLEV